MDDLEPSTTRRVALRKESVDRNAPQVVRVVLIKKSLSARRAWIEIWLAGYRQALAHVALRKESVDRNFHISFRKHRKE